MRKECHTQELRMAFVLSVSVWHLYGILLVYGILRCMAFCTGCMAFCFDFVSVECNEFRLRVCNARKMFLPFFCFAQFKKPIHFVFF